MGATQATQSSRQTGAVGARKSEAAKTGRQAAPHASRRMSVASGDAGLESAVGTPETPTANEKAAAPSHLCPCPSLHLHAPCLCRRAAVMAQGAR